jgi:hypothetical protein
MKKYIREYNQWNSYCLFLFQNGLIYVLNFAIIDQPLLDLALKLGVLRQLVICDCFVCIEFKIGIINLDFY